MKMNRAQLKALIKECIVEVLSEGTDNVGVMTESSTRAKPPQKSARSTPTPRPTRPASAPAVEKPRVPKQPTMFDDPVMNSIMADTAQTTVREQAKYGHSGPSRPGTDSTGPADPYAAALYERAPDEVFGTETTSKWERLAFNNGTPARSEHPDFVDANGPKT